MKRRGSPVRVRRVWSRLRHRVMWMWECTAEDCPRARGYHHNQRRRDLVLARMGKQPDPPPFERALSAALTHFYWRHDPAGPAELFAKLEEISSVDYDVERHGTLFAWAVDTLDWLASEEARHGNQVTEIHGLVTAAGHDCARGDLTAVIAEILGR